MTTDDVRIVPLRCGVLSASGDFLVAGWEGSLDLQVWAFVVRHPAGDVLFDTGMHPLVRTDALGYIGTDAELFTIGYDDGDDVASQLTAAGIDPSGIRTVVCSHLHWDHAGGNGLLSEAEVLVQRAERDIAREHGNGYGYVQADWDTGQDLHLLDGEHDLFGDGRVMCVPTPGHTPGHQSLLVRLEARDVVLTADACYVRRTLERMALPSFGWDLDRQREVLRWFRTLEAGGAVLVFGHEMELTPQAEALLSPT